MNDADEMKNLAIAAVRKLDYDALVEVFSAVGVAPNATESLCCDWLTDLVQTPVVDKMRLEDVSDGSMSAVLRFVKVLSEAVHARFGAVCGLSFLASSLNAVVVVLEAATTPPKSAALHIPSVVRAALEVVEKYRFPKTQFGLAIKHGRLFAHALQCVHDGLAQGSASELATNSLTRVGQMLAKFAGAEEVETCALRGTMNELASACMSCTSTVLEDHAGVIASHFEALHKIFKHMLKSHLTQLSTPTFISDIRGVLQRVVDGWSEAHDSGAMTSTSPVHLILDVPIAVFALSVTALKEFAGLAEVAQKAEVQFQSRCVEHALRAVSFHFQDVPWSNYATFMQNFGEFLRGVLCLPYCNTESYEAHLQEWQKWKAHDPSDPNCDAVVLPFVEALNISIRAGQTCTTLFSDRMIDDLNGISPQLGQLIEDTVHSSLSRQLQLRVIALLGDAVSSFVQVSKTSKLLLQANEPVVKLVEKGSFLAVAKLLFAHVAGPDSQEDVMFDASAALVAAKQSCPPTPFGEMVWAHTTAGDVAHQFVGLLDGVEDH